MANRRGRQHGRAARPPATSTSDPTELLAELAAAGVPPELLAALQGANGPEDLAERLMRGLLASLMAGWAPLLERGCDELSAELTGIEFVATVRGIAPDEAGLTDVLIGMIAAAEESAIPEALAMLRVLAVVGPPAVRPTAIVAADRLVGSGLADAPWAHQLGRPAAGACYGYADPFGCQEVVAATFSYGRRQHAFAVLIDHGLGGGVKDCWISGTPKKLRASYRENAQRAGESLLEYSPADTRLLLERALAAPPCPVEPDQIEDVGAHLGLLRDRVALLAQDAVAPRRSRPRSGVHQLKISLREAKPPIWRRVQVPSDVSLEHLHEIIQAAFGWEGCHMWVFATDDGEYGRPDAELGHADAARKKLATMAPRAGDRIRYTYDFGDDWEHEIVVEEVLGAEPGVAYPRCITGRRACPPEDCGGLWAYDYLLEVLADPDHPEHAERLEWLGLESGTDLDPARFDLGEVNEALSRLARVLVLR